MDLSIVFVNYNTEKLLINSIKSIYENTSGLEFEIIIVDNASAKNSVSLIKSYFPELKYIENQDNEGFGRANNKGLKYCEGKYILFLNSDTVITDNALFKCFEFMESDYAKNINIGLLGCKLKNLAGVPQLSTFSKSNIHKMFLNVNPFISKILAINRKRDLFDFDSVQYVAGISGAFMFFRHEVLEKIRPFDPDIFLYSEENEFCRNRVSKICKIIYWPKTEIIHLEGSSAPKPLLFKQNMLSNALVWYKSGISNYLFYIIYSIINFCCFVFAYPLVSKNTKQHFKLYIKGYLTIFPYMFWDIIKFPKSWGARKTPLKLRAFK